MVVASRTGGEDLVTTGRDEIDRLVERLTERKDAWVRLGPAARIPYLEQCMDGMLDVAESWVLEACRHQGIDPSSPMAGESWLSGPMVTIEAFRQYVAALRAGGQPRPRRLREAANGQTVVDVFPRSLSERFLYHNMTAEIWIEPGQPPTQGRIYREKAKGHYPRDGSPSCSAEATSLPSPRSTCCTSCSPRTRSSC